MKNLVFRIMVPLIAAAIGCGTALAQAPDWPQPGIPPVAPPPAVPDIAPLLLDWTPPALAQLGSQAVARESFTLDRTMLAAAAGLLPDSEADLRQTAAKLDGVSVHMLRFPAAGAADPALVAAVRDSYHLHGWTHVVNSLRANTPGRNDTTDVWLVLEGVNVRGAVVLVATPKSLTLTTVAGNLSPVDLLHLRGHFGIPRFDGGDINRAPRIEQ